MAKKISKSAWKIKDNNKGVHVSALMGAVLWVSRTLFGAPAHLKRTRIGLLLTVSPLLARLQRVLAVILSILPPIVTVVLDMTGESQPHSAARKENVILTIILDITGFVSIMTLYGYGVWTGFRRLTSISSVLRTLQKIKTSLSGTSLTLNTKGHDVKLFFIYIIWQAVTCMEDMIWTAGIIRKEKEYLGLIVTFDVIYAIMYYQYMTIQLLQLQWSITIMELQSTLNLLNNQLQELLLTPRFSTKGMKIKLYSKELVRDQVIVPIQQPQEIEQPECDMQRIHDLNHYHEIICDLMFQIDKDNGVFIFLCFMLISLHLLLTPHTLINNLGLSVMTYAYAIFLRQSNWFLVHFFQLMLLVEPCHRLRVQLDRTRSLLSKIVGQSDGYGDCTQLDLFVLQARMRDDALVPMGLCSIGRPLMVSILGGVATYLVIVFQVQDTYQVL